MQYFRPKRHKLIPDYTQSHILLDLAAKPHVLHIRNTRVEAGSNTSTVNLRVVRDDEMGLKKAAP
jgi:hypothetical protein